MSDDPKYSTCQYCGRVLKNRSSAIRHTMTCKVAKKESKDSGKLKLPPQKKKGRPPKSAEEKAKAKKEIREEIEAEKEAERQAEKDAEKEADEQSDSDSYIDSDSENINEKVSEDISEKVSEDISENISSNISEKVAEESEDPEPDPEPESVSESFKPLEPQPPSGDIMKETEQLQNLLDKFEAEKKDPIDAAVAEQEEAEELERANASKNIEKMINDNKKKEIAARALNLREKSIAAKEKANAIKEGKILPDIEHFSLTKSLGHILFRGWVSFQEKVERISPITSGVAFRMEKKRKQYTNLLDQSLRTILPSGLSNRMNGPKSELFTLAVGDYVETIGDNFGNMKLNLPDIVLPDNKTANQKQVDKKIARAKAAEEKKAARDKAARDKAADTNAATPIPEPKQPDQLQYEELYPDLKSGQMASPSKDMIDNAPNLLAKTVKTKPKKINLMQLITRPNDVVNDIMKGDEPSGFIF